MGWTVEEALPELGQGLFGRLRTAAGTDWHAYVTHPVVAGLADGTLPPARFRAFLVQDYLYLLHYARAYAIAIAKSDTLAGMRSAASVVNGLLLTEISMHVTYCAGWGLDEAALEAATPSLELLAYTGFLMDRAHSGDVLELLVVLAPCLAGYAEIGARLMADTATKREGNPYLPWIETYAGAPYRRVLAEGLDRLQASAEARGGAVRFDALLRDFRMAVRLETQFWNTAR